MNAGRMMEWLMNSIQKGGSKFKQFRKIYRYAPLTSTYDLIHQSNHHIQHNEIIFAILWGSDNSQSHAVAIVNDWIFDGNCQNALPLCKENLDICCGAPDAKFVRIRKGYRFYLNPNKGKRKRK